MDISCIPDELILHIAWCLDRADLKSWASTSRRYYRVVDPILYARDACQDGENSALTWAATRGVTSTAIKSLLAKTSPDQGLLVAVEHAQSHIVSLVLDMVPAGQLASQLDGKLSPLGLATKMGNLSMVSRLLDSPHFHVHLRDELDGLTPLARACQLGFSDIVLCVIRSGRSEMSQHHGENNKWVTPLNMAILGHHVEVVRTLCDNSHIATMSPLPFAFRATQLAILHGKPGIVRYLVTRSDVDINKADVDGRTPLMHALVLDKYEIVEELLGTGTARFDLTDDGGNTPLMLAINFASVELIQLLLETHGVSHGIDKQNNAGETALGLAISVLHPASIIRSIILLSRQLINVPCNLDGSTPLMVAVRSSHSSALQLILRHGGKPSLKIQDNLGQTPLIVAARMGSPCMLLDLMRHPELNDFSIIDHQGCTVVSAAVCHPELPVFRALFASINTQGTAAKATLNLPNNYGYTPLFLAAKYGNYDAVIYLTKVRTVDPGRAAQDGMTPLMVAAVGAHYWIARWLTFKFPNLNVNATCCRGRTALFYAVMGGNSALVNYLAHLDGIDLDLPDDLGRSPLHFAVLSGQYQIVTILLSTNRVAVDCPADDGTTALSIALYRELEIAEELVMYRLGMS